MLMVDFMRRLSEVMKASGCRNGRWKTWRMNNVVSIARSEYSCSLPRAPVLAGRHAASASSVNQIVIATLAQRFVIFGPVGHFVTRFFDLMTAALIVFVRHRLFCR